MNNKKGMFWLMVIGAGVGLFLLSGFTSPGSIFMTTEDLIISLEGFVDHPYWDSKQYSWGYGTKAPGATGIITQEQARQELRQHVQIDYDYLLPLITVPLSVNQWAALLSFSYNLGPGNADNLVNDINAESPNLQSHWKQYVYADGVVNSNLVARRAREWDMWAAG